MSSATPGDIFAALYAAHQIGDYWLQTSAQAEGKSHKDAAGRLACARHVVTMTVCKTAALSILHVSGRRVEWRRAVLALAADAASHYWADRRATLEGLAGKLGGTVIPGKGEYYRAGGAPFLDQAWAHRVAVDSRGHRGRKGT